MKRMTTATKLHLALVFILFAPSVSFVSLDYCCRPSTATFLSRTYRKLPENKDLLKRQMSSTEDNANMDRPIAGSFFNQVPSTKNAVNDTNSGTARNIVDSSLARIIDEKIPVAKVTGFGSKLPSTRGDNSNNANILTALMKQKREQLQQRPEHASSNNDINNLQYDEKGYTLYSNEKTGEKSRVFDALVQYPCDFDIKIVGATDGTFVIEMIQLVAESCEVTTEDIRWRERVNGKWTAITVTAPIKSSTMLYELYETIDRDSRVRFKF